MDDTMPEELERIQAVVDRCSASADRVEVLLAAAIHEQRERGSR